MRIVPLKLRPHHFVASVIVLFATAGPAEPGRAVPLSPNQVTVVHGNWAGSAAGVPGTRGGHCAVLAGNRVIVFGGEQVPSVDNGYLINETWQLALGDSPTWSRILPAGTLPSPRANMSGIYDPLRRRLIVFGGGENSNVLRNDVWALSLTGTPTWTQLTPAGTPPSPRAGHEAVYDPVRDQMIIFGGQGSGTTLFNDVWSLSLSGSPSWTQLAPSGVPPTSRLGSAVIYDPVRDRLVLFGGRGVPGPPHGNVEDHGFLNDTWQLSLTGTPAWTQLAPSGTLPEPRTTSAIYDPVRDRMVIFGGLDTYTVPCCYIFVNMNDVQSLNLAGGTSWQQLAPTGTTGQDGRYSHSIIYDRARDRMVLHGGFHQGGSPSFDFTGFGDTRFLNWGSPPTLVVPETLSFPSGFVGFTSTQTMVVTNAGSGSVTVSNIASDDPTVTASPTTFTLTQGESRNITVQWAPTSTGPLSASLIVTSDESDAPTQATDVSGSAALLPVSTVTPESVHVTMQHNQISTHTLRIDNTGPGTLDFTAVEVASAPGAPSTAAAASGRAGASKPGLLRAGGPDGFGYTYQDSDEPGGPAFSWIDVRSLGFQIPADGNDQYVGPIDIGFTFPFYGHLFTSFRLCTNGWISFTSTGQTTATNVSLPNTGLDTPVNLLAVYWDDLTFGGTPRAWYYVNNGRLVIQYEGVERVGEPGLSNSFEVILYPDGTIVYQYGTMSSTVTSSATIGIMNATRDDALQVVYNAPYVHNDLAIRFTYPPVDFFGFSPTSGTVGPGGHADLTLTFDTTSRPDGDYPVTVRIQSNDPYVPTRDVPILLTVATPVGVPEMTVERFGLRLAGPNPTTGGTRLELAVPKQAEVVVRVFDIHGALVRDLARREFVPGVHPMAWDGTDANGRPARAGVYFVQASGPLGRQDLRVVLMR